MEILQPQPTLEQRLSPVIKQLRRIEQPTDRYAVVKDWFDTHTENLAADMADLTYLCTLPDDERRFLAYPVLGNWMLARLRTFQPESPEQADILAQLTGLVRERRFNNSHTEAFYEDREGFAKREDLFNSTLLSHPDLATPVCAAIVDVAKEIGLAVREGSLPQSDEYIIDIGHGLAAPARHFAHLVFNFILLKEHKKVSPLDLTIMVVDDQESEAWYQRMVAVGFKDQPGQRGFFPDCESALSALEKGHYDVILTDIELGEGKMDGITFAELAYTMQQKNGINPLISVFSYSSERLKDAEERLRWQPKLKKKPEIIFQQVNLTNNKIDFTAMQFRTDVTSKRANQD